VLVHGELWTAVAEGPGIPAGERVRVVHVEGLRLRVERASGQTA
jgi:membrane-bound ClpP family serine protease